MAIFFTSTYYLFVLVVILFSPAAFGSSRWANCKHEYFVQKVDHFNVLQEDPDTYRGEAAVEFFEFQEESALDWAEYYGAHYIALEHRYYGKSRPRSTLSDGDVRFLSSQQALADAAVFVTSLKNQYRGKWIVLGCSYSGALSAWFRSKYPDLVVGSIAPSGPVLATSNFTKFFHNFGNVAGDYCVQSVKTAVNLIERMVQSHEGLEQLSTLFHSCRPLTSGGVMFFKWAITEYLATTPQWENAPTYNMTAACRTINNNPPVKGWAEAMLRDTGSQCLDFQESNFLANMEGSDSWGSGRAWWYQKCTEFGFFQVGYPSTSIFFGDMNRNFVRGFCRKLFPTLKIDAIFSLPDTEWTNAYYGGMNVTGDKILFTNGHYDPWHTLSINEPIANRVSVATYMAGHCAPMTAPHQNDHPSVLEARAIVKAFIGKLLK